LGAGVRFDFALVASKLPDIFYALGVTLFVSIVSLIGAALLGFVVAVARRYGPRWLGLALGAYVEVFRGTPFLVQLYLLYFGGPYAGLSLDAIPAGLLALSVYGAAYFSEIFRAGFEAVPRGHVEAGECLGLSRIQIVGRILLPEMTMLVLPASVNMAIILMKETAVLSVVTVPELTMTISAIGTEFYAFVECLFLLALFYWGLTEICAWLGRISEARLSRFRFAAA
jgi:polar amino acid transport system permease protein